MLHRRRFLGLLGGGLLGGVVAAGCGGGDDAAAPPGQSPTVPPEPTDGAGGGRLLVPAFSDGLRAPAVFVAGAPQRAPLVLFSAEGTPVANGVPETLEVTLTAPDGTATTSTLPRRDQGIFIPYFAVTFTPAAAGEYSLRATVDGVEQSVPFLVVERGELPLVQIGDPMPAFPTPTVADPREVEVLCTRFEGQCPFHDVSLDAALAAGRPVVLLVSTPAFCQTQTCGPVLDLLVEQAAALDATVIHVEVYRVEDPFAEGDPAAVTAEAVQNLELTFEPVIYVANADGTVTGRLEFNWDGTELAEVLATV
jgi:hypothetical protein